MEGLLLQQERFFTDLNRGETKKEKFCSDLGEMFAAVQHRIKTAGVTLFVLRTVRGHAKF